MYADAAALMLKRKIHRIPIVNDKNQVIGEFVYGYRDQTCYYDVTWPIVFSSKSLDLP